MRYRVNDYKIEIDAGTVFVYLKLPDYLKAGGVIDYSLCSKLVPQALRLVIDETQRIVFSSSMNKNIDEFVFNNSSIDTDFGNGYEEYDFYVAFIIPEGRTVATTDAFTIEFDWGEEPSSLAKQGTDPTVTLTGVSQALTPIANEYTQGKQAIVNALQGYGVECSTDETLSELAEKMRGFVNLGGCLFNSDSNYTLADILGYLYSRPIVVKFTNMTKVQLNCTAGSDNIRSLLTSPNLREFVSYTLQMLPETSSTASATQEIEMLNTPNWYDSGFYGWGRGTYNWDKLKHIRCKNGTFIFGGYQNYNNNLNRCYDFVPTGTIRSSIGFWYWSAKYALDVIRTDILEKDEWDDPNEPTETFTCNRDKFKWYFENHFLPCFADLVAEGSSATPTLTLYTTVYDFANTEYTAADPTKTFIDVLTDRGWTVASAS